MHELTNEEMTLLRMCFDARLNQLWGMKRLSTQDRRAEQLKVRLLAAKLGIGEI